MAHSSGARKKLLLMGRSGAGKTSMRSIIFANYLPRDTSQLGATIKTEASMVSFFNDLELSIWDCGGQDIFFEEMLSTMEREVFSEAAVLIYVFDVTTETAAHDLQYFSRTLQSLHRLSPRAKLFCLIHKIDTISPDDREMVWCPSHLQVPTPWLRCEQPRARFSAPLASAFGLCSYPPRVSLPTHIPPTDLVRVLLAQVWPSPLLTYPSSTCGCVYAWVLCWRLWKDGLLLARAWQGECWLVSSVRCVAAWPPVRPPMGK